MGLLKTTTKGMVWTTFSMVIRSVVSLLQVSILTRYLDKSEFGLIAIATVFIGFTQIFLDLGLSSGIMHKQDITSKQYSSLFWLNIFTGIILTLILIAFIPLIANAYNDNSLIPILSFLSLTIFFSSLGSQHRTVQQKEMRFKYIAIIEIVCSFLTMILAVILAIHGYGVFSLVYSTLFNAILNNLLFLIIGLYNDRNIRLYFRLQDTYPFLKIGVFSLGTRVLDYFSREIDIIFISATYGKDILGLYSLCKKLIIALYNAINPIITKVLTPLFAKIQTDKSRIKNVYYNLIETLSLTNFPIYFLVSIFSTGILYFIYGEEYKEGAIILSILSVYYGKLSTGNPVGSLQIALGRTDAGFYWTIFRIVLTLIAVYIGSFFSIEGLVFSMFIMSLLSIPLSWRITIRPLIGGEFWEYFFLSFKPFIVISAVSVPFYFFFYDTTSIFLMIIFAIIFILTTIVVSYKIFPKSYIINTLIINNINKRS
jgi:O-antigen/teichoic acid export membrane protein